MFTPKVGKYFGTIEYLDVAGIQKVVHATCVTSIQPGADNNHSVVKEESIPSNFALYRSVSNFTVSVSSKDELCRF